MCVCMYMCLCESMGPDCETSSRDCKYEFDLVYYRIELYVSETRPSEVIKEPKDVVYLNPVFVCA